MKKPQTIPYGRQSIDKDDIAAVAEVLRSDWLTTGPKVPEFEEAIAGFCDAKYGVAVSSGTAALHTAMYAIGIGPGDEVIVPAMTFAATANCVVYQGGRPVFADVERETLLIDIDDVRRKITNKTKAIIAMDYAGQPCDYDALRHIAEEHGLFLVADACHSLGAEYKGRKTGTLADLTVFSFHPVKHITTGEGGMVVTNNLKLADKARLFRNHGICRDHHQRSKENTWRYEMIDLGYNYRLSDIQCALGISQLEKLPKWLKIRRQIAARYDKAFAGTDISPLKLHEERIHAYHLYVVQVPTNASRQKVYQKMRESKIGVNVHYLPVHLHPFYRQKFKTEFGQCPVAEKMYEYIITLPLHQSMAGGNDTQRVIGSLREAVE